MKAIIAIIFTMVCALSYSQTEKESLYISGKKAFDSDDFVNAVIFLYAYREINLTYLETIEPEKMKKIDDAIAYSKDNIINLAQFKIKRVTPGNIEGRFGVDCYISPLDLERSMKINGQDFQIKGLQLELEKAKI